MNSDRSSRQRRSPLVVMGVIVTVVAGLGAAGVLRAAEGRESSITRLEELAGVLATAPKDYPAENYLLVGSDSRAEIDPNSPDYKVVAGEEVSGNRSDTIMVLRQEANGSASLMSLPRDLWLKIPGTGKSNRINSAHNSGPQLLTETVTQSLGIPIHHYIEVDMEGFKKIVDTLGGVEICVPLAARDARSGLHINQGCQLLDGTQGLAYARSRHYQEWTGDEWKEDPRGDLGRIERQQTFIRAAVSQVLAKLQNEPFTSGSLIDAVSKSMSMDPGLDIVKAAGPLRSAVQQGLHTYRLPVVDDQVGDAAVLRLGDGSEEVLDYFRGTGPPPVEYETVGTTVPAATASTTG